MNFLILGFLVTSYASASLTDRIRATIGTGHSQERVCIAILETGVEHSESTGVGATYALNSFRAFENGLKVFSEKPELQSGYSIVENGQSIAGSLTTKEVSARAQGILTLLSNEKTAESTDEQQLKYIAFSTSEGVPANKVITSLIDRLALAKDAEIVTAPFGLIIPSLLAFEYANLTANLFDHPGAYSIGGLAFLYFATDGLTGFKRSLPGHNAAPNFYSDLSQFLAERKNQKRTFFLLSETVEINRELFNRSLGLKDPDDPQWNEVEKQYSIMFQRMPAKNIFRLFRLGELTKTVWLHTDMLIEKAPDGGEPEVHFLIQFSQKKPDFPKKPKQVEELVLNPQSGRLTPVPIPIRPSNH